jgi:diketogulonate reductase-like aldo/keto reductase
MTIKAYNGVECPSFMYGTAWKKDATEHLVKLAIENGFTAIDTANQLIHYDEKRVGNALLDLRAKGITREKIFLQTKFTSVGGQGKTTPYDASAPLATQVNQSFDSSLEHLHTDYLDSYVLHGPYQRDGLGTSDWKVWSAIESLYTAGKCRMIGVSNVSAGQLLELCAKAKVKPMAVQNRCYAILGWDAEVRAICREHSIIYQGFSLLTANQRYFHEADLRATAKRLRVTESQVIFAFSLHVGMLPLTGTSYAKHMQEDLASVELKLTDDEIELIENIAG